MTSPGTIVTAGENVVDLIKQQDGMFHAVPGGSPLNIAIALGRLEVPVGYAMPISADQFGNDMVASLAHNGVNYLPTCRPNRPTGLAIVNVTADGQPMYSFYRQGAADVALEPDELPQLDASVVHLQVGGSPSLGQDQCGEELTKWALGLAPSLSMSLDPNVRPALVANKKRFLARCEQLLSRCNICRLSEEDAEFMYGDTNGDRVADILLEQGVALAVVTKGANGALLATAHERVTVSAPTDLLVKDTVAAGDCFFGAMLCWLLERKFLGNDKVGELTKSQLCEVGTWAAAAAALNCTRDGCDPPQRDEIDELLGMT